MLWKRRKRIAVDDERLDGNGRGEGGGCGLVIGGGLGWLVEAHTDEEEKEEAMGASEWKMNE